MMFETSLAIAVGVFVGNFAALSLYYAFAAWMGKK